MEVSLLPLDQGGRNLDQHPLAELKKHSMNEVTGESRVKGIKSRPNRRPILALAES